MKLNIRTISFGIIIIICVIAIVMALYMQFAANETQPTNTIDNPSAVSEENKLLAQNFNKLFENALDYQGYNVDTLGIIKNNRDKDIIYTAVNLKKVVTNQYDLDLKIPVINISGNTSVEKFNEKIQSIFANKANEILQKTDIAQQNTIYTIDYMAYVNTNILSLVIRSTLKEGNQPQRVIIQTYNYNLSTNEEMTLSQILEIRGLNKQTIENTIANEVRIANNEAENLKRLGYLVYTRDLTSSIYKLENTDNYMLGPDNKLYIIYPYGNANFTDEMDVIVF